MTEVISTVKAQLFERQIYQEKEINKWNEIEDIISKLQIYHQNNITKQKQSGDINDQYQIGKKRTPHPQQNQQVRLS